MSIRQHRAASGFIQCCASFLAAKQPYTYRRNFVKLLNAGVLLNTVLPDWLITFLLTALLLWLTYRTFRKSLSLHQASWQADPLLHTRRLLDISCVHHMPVHTHACLLACLVA